MYVAYVIPWMDVSALDSQSLYSLFNPIKLEVMTNVLAYIFSSDIWAAKTGGGYSQSQPWLHSKILSQKEENQKKEEEELEEGSRIILYLIINIYIYIYMLYRPSLCDCELLSRLSLCYLYLWPGPFCTLHLYVQWPVLSLLGYLIGVAKFNWTSGFYLTHGP